MALDIAENANLMVCRRIVFFSISYQLRDDLAVLHNVI
jgi:hypothetical protein